MAFRTIGIFAALLTSMGFVPQIIKAIRIKEMRDVSLIMLLILFIGTLLWIIYGLSIGDRIVVTANAITCATTVILLSLKMLYNGGPE